MAKHKKSFKDIFNETYNGKFELQSKYLNNDVFISIKHTDCERIFSTTPSLFKKNPNCPHCCNLD